MNAISQQVFAARRIAISALHKVARHKTGRAFSARVLASASCGVSFLARETTRRVLVPSRSARSLSALAIKTRDFAAREYSHNARLRVVLPLTGVALAAALLAFGSSRATAKTSNQAAQFVADDSSDSARVLARADADFDNAEPGSQETEWGRFVADAMKSATGADIALVNAASLSPGNLPKGDVTSADIDALLAYSDDEIVTRKISGAQLRAALELAVKDAPNDSSRFLHVAGMAATFDAQAPHARLRDLKVNGHAVQDSDVYNVAMPIGLSQGAGGFFTVWGKGENAKNGGSLHATLARYIAKRAHLSPDTKARIAAN